MTFQTLVEHIQILPLSEKEEMRALLDRYVAEERRAQYAAHDQQRLDELRRDALEFSDAIPRLRALKES